LRDRHDSRRELALWTGILSGPLLWLMLLEINYVLSYVACETRQTWFLHLATFIALALVAGAGLWAWAAARGSTDSPDALTFPVGEQTSDTRTRWMARAAVASAVWFIAVIISFEVPMLVLGPCQ
jgi:hypothetical protein